MTFPTFRLSLSTALILTLFVGCSDNKPAGFPEVHPTTITILRSGDPLSEVNVILEAIEPAFHNIVYSGETNARGIAVMSTIYPGYRARGLPVGEYIVVLARQDVIEGERPREEINRMSPEEAAAYSAELERLRRNHTPTIPPHLGDFAASPLRVTVERGSNDFTLDISDFPAGTR